MANKSMLIKKIQEKIKKHKAHIKTCRAMIKLLHKVGG